MLHKNFVFEWEYSQLLHYIILLTFISVLTYDVLIIKNVCMYVQFNKQCYNKNLVIITMTNK